MANGWDGHSARHLHKQYAAEGFSKLAGGPTQGWARLWWCLRTKLSTHHAGLAFSEHRTVEVQADQSRAGRSTELKTG